MKNSTRNTLLAIGIVIFFILIIFVIFKKENINQTAISLDDSSEKNENISFRLEAEIRVWLTEGSIDYNDLNLGA